MFGAILGVGIGRRDGFGATTGREAISAQDIGFLGVATGEVGGVSGSEVFGGVPDEVTGGVSTNAGSLGGGGVAGGVSTAIGAMSVRSAVTAGTAFDAGSAVSLRGIDVTIFLTGFGCCCCTTALCSLARRTFSFSCSCGSNF